MKIFRDPQQILTFFCGLTLVLSIFGLHPMMPYCSVLFGSYFALKSAWEAIRSRQLDVNFLMVLAAIGAVCIGRSIDAAVLLFLFSLSSTLESMAMAKTQSAIEDLIKLRPDRAILVQNGEDVEVPTESLKPGDCVRVMAYQQIPADGVIFQGKGSVDESSMTGESTPIEKKEGDDVLAGTQNLDHMLILKITHAGKESKLEKIVKLVLESQKHKASSEKMSVWFGKRYTFFVLGCFLISLFTRVMFGNNFETSLYSSLTLLVALSPCALVISIPASNLSALAYAARQGILVRGGRFIEAAGKVDTLAIDKTGTLTQGILQVEEIYTDCSWNPKSIKNNSNHLVNKKHVGTLCTKECIQCWSIGEEILPVSQHALAMAATAEKGSTHPIAEAIVRCANDHRVDFMNPDQHRNVVGLGVTAVIDGISIRIGQPSFFRPSEDPMPKAFLEHVEEMQGRGLTAVLMRFRDGWAAFGIRDQIREESKILIDGLKEEGITRIAMLTGDHFTTAQSVAKAVGISEIYSRLMPDEKTALIEEWSAKGHKVLMIGDGVNDAPSLASAYIGIAMGGLGSDIALKSADVVLVQDKIEKTLELIKLGKRTNRVIYMNLIFASGIITALTLSALFFTLPLPLAVIGHEGSTLIVILNGLRLLRRT